MNLKQTKTPPNLAAALAALKHQSGICRILTDPADCYVYGYDNSQCHHLPDAVIFPTDTKSTQAIVKCCCEHAIPLTVRGRGTGTPGGAVPVGGGVVLCTTEMAQVLGYSPQDKTITVQTGMLNESVQQAVAAAGLFWPPDPTSKAYCPVGGNLGYNSAGPMGVKYLSTRHHVLGLTAVLGDGRILKTGVKTTKGVVGYDFTRLLIGSEGTLGVITEATLRLSPHCAHRTTLRILFDNIEKATESVCHLLQHPISPCVLEFMDTHCVQLIQTHQGIDLPKQTKSLLLVEFEGHSAKDALTQANQVIHDCALTQALDLQVADTSEAKQQLWQARRALSPTLKQLAPNKINEDVVVPISRIPLFLEKIDSISKKHQIMIVSFGHIGNGNLHVNILYDKTKEAPQAEKALRDIFDVVLMLEGTLSGEHGIGLVKQAFLTEELDTTSLALMQSLKQIFDPKGILGQK